MSSLPEIIALQYLRAYQYRLTFNDGLEGELDFAEYLDRGPVFTPLRDQALFRQATIQGGTISWSNGADVAPETLYEKLLRAKQIAEKAL